MRQSNERRSSRRKAMGALGAASVALGAASLAGCGEAPTMTQYQKERKERLDKEVHSVLLRAPDSLISKKLLSAQYGAVEINYATFARYVEENLGFIDQRSPKVKALLVERDTLLNHNDTFKLTFLDDLIRSGLHRDKGNQAQTLRNMLAALVHSGGNIEHQKIGIAKLPYVDLMDYVKKNLKRIAIEVRYARSNGKTTFDGPYFHLLQQTR